MVPFKEQVPEKSIKVWCSEAQSQQRDGVVVHREVVKHVSVAVALSLLASVGAECQDAEA